jgi:hypothetical protein
MPSSHLVLFEHLRQAIQWDIAEVVSSCNVPPWQVFVIVVDLRSEFGRSIGLRFYKRVDVDRMIRAAEAREEPPGLSVPLVAELGLAIVRVFTPDLEAQVLLRPPKTATLLIVDEFDAAIIGIGRLLDARLALS